MIAGERTGATDHAMTGHHEGEWVLADRGADRARGLGRAELGGDAGIAGQVSHRDLEQRFPYAHLPVSADQHHAQWLLGPPAYRIEDAARERGRARNVIDIVSVGPAAAHVAECGLLVARVREGESRKPALARHDERAAERRRMKAIVDGEPLSA